MNTNNVILKQVKLLGLILAVGILVGRNGSAQTDDSGNQSGWQSQVVVWTDDPSISGAQVTNLTAVDMSSVPVLSIPNGTGSSGSDTYQAQSASDDGSDGLATSANLIPEMAQALQYDPSRIYFFVRDEIAFDPYYGLKKGPERTLLDRQGNDTDQAYLLMELLNASGITADLQMTAECYGYTNASNMASFSMSSSDNYDLPHWLGVSNDMNTVVNTLLAGGYPYVYTGSGSVSLPHVWVHAYFNGTDYYMDPSFKPSIATTGINITALIGYNRSTLYSDAGGTTTADYVQNLSETGVTNYLTSLAQTLRANLSNSYPNASWGDIMGSATIASGSDSTMRFGEPALYLEGSSVPSCSVHYFQMVQGTWTNTLTLDQIANHKLWISYTNRTGSAYPVAQLWFDNTILSTESGTFSTSAASPAITIYHPDGQDNNSNVLYSIDRQVYSLTRSNQNSYAISVGFGADAPGRMVSSSFGAFERLNATGLATNDVRLLSSGLQTIGQSWLQETDLYRAMTYQLFGTRILTHHRVGIAAQEASYYVDLRNEFTSALGANQTLANVGVAHAYYQASAMEHGVLEQLQHASRPAVSTIKVLHQANLIGLKIYRATSSNWNSVVKPALTGYSTQDLNTFYTNAVLGGHVLILPQSGQVTNQQWAGEGYADWWFNGSSSVLSMVIGGGYHGGYAALLSGIAVNTVDRVVQQTVIPPIQTWTLTSREPVDLQSGAYLNDSTDLSFDPPMGFQFTRSYNSKARNRSGPLGYGWTHSGNITAAVHSDFAACLGSRAPQDATAALVAAVVNQDLISTAVTNTSPRDWALAAVVANWAMSQLTDQSVSISIGQKVMTFNRQPDGYYTPPPGITTSLSGTSGAFAAQERLANRYVFNSQNLVSSVTDPDGNQLTFSYDASGTNLQQVSCSSFGNAKTMHFNYSGARLSSVADDAGTVSFGYTTAGDLGTITDPANNPWLLGYDGNHRLTSLTDPENHVTIQNSYNSADQVTNQISATSHPWNYYCAGKQSVEQSPLGLQTDYYYDDQGRLTSVSTPDGAETYTSYDGQNHVIQTVDAVGYTNNMVYDGNNNLTTKTEAVGRPEQRTTINVYDGQSQLTSVTNAAGKPTSYQYNATHHPNLITDALGNQQSFTYQGNGLKQSFRIISSGLTLNSGTYTYDGFGYQNTVFLQDSGTTTSIHTSLGDVGTLTDPLLKKTVYIYDQRRLLTNVIDNATGKSWKSYYRNGLLKTETDPRQFTTTYSYTPAYKKLTVSAPDSGVVSNAYDADDRLVTTWTPRVYPTQFYLDGVGRVTNQVSTYNTQQTGYYLNGNVAVTVDAASNTTWNVYDGLSQLTEQARPLGNEFYYRDAMGKVTNRVDELTHSWRSQFDDLERLRFSYRPSNAYEQYSYDGQGNRTGFINADSHPMEFTFDAQSHLKTVTNAMGQVITCGYDTAGNLTSRIDALTRTNSLFYDGLNRLTNTLYADTSFARLGYDADSNVATSQTAQSNIILGYDNCDRLSTVNGQINSAAWSVTYGCDKSGNVTNLVYPGGKTVQYVYDEEERLKSVTDWNNKQTTFGYDNAGKLTSIAYANGTSANFGYDSENRVTSLYHAAPGGGSHFVDRTNFRNGIGYKLQENINAGLNPVPTVKKNKQQTFDAADRLLISTDQSGNATTNAFNANGDLVSVSATSTVSYGWDCADRLTAITNGATVTTFMYDAQGNRIGRISGTTTNYFVLNYRAGLKNVLAELDGAGNVTRWYIWGPKGLVCHIDAADGTHYYHSDEQGSTLALTDGNGNVSDQFAYAPYGELTARNGTTSTPYRWLGGVAVRADDGPNIYAMQRRFYSADQKRFLSTDSKGIDSFPNLYAYGNLNPTVNTDPTGLWAGLDDLIFSGGGAAIGLGGQGLQDLISGQLSPVQNYIGAATGGATSGAILLYTANPIAAGVGGAAMGNLVKQIGNNSSSVAQNGQLAGFNTQDFAWDVGLAGATSLIPAPGFQGINAGQGSYLSISKQITTKFVNGQIENVSAQTAMGMFTGQAVENILPGTVETAVGQGGFDRVNGLLQGNTSNPYRNLGANAFSSYK